MVPFQYIYIGTISTIGTIGIIGIIGVMVPTYICLFIYFF